MSRANEGRGRARDQRKKRDKGSAYDQLHPQGASLVSEEKGSLEIWVPNPGAEEGEPTRSGSSFKEGIGTKRKREKGRRGFATAAVFRLSKGGLLRDRGGKTGEGGNRNESEEVSVNSMGLLHPLGMPAVPPSKRRKTKSAKARTAELEYRREVRMGSTGETT